MKTIEIESIWHDAKIEIPTKYGVGVLVLCKNKNKPDGIWLIDLIQCWEGKWEPRENYETPIKWAYVEELYPDNPELSISAY